MGLRADRLQMIRITQLSLVRSMLRTAAAVLNNQKEESLREIRASEMI